ncbi:AAA domain-containing protein [Nocardia sp. NPDC088792]|uniref:AAA domain-containing protein n=1 Tax=Nocardia sp. NPDC088792 TaxID=3364332 RepID=UPI00382B9662
MSSGEAVGKSAANDLVDRGARLFDYLAKAQTIGRPRVQDIAAYQRDGEVLWVADLPVHAAITYQANDPGIPFLMVQKVTVSDVPEPDVRLRIWLDPGWGEPDQAPTLRATRVDEAGAILLRADHPEVAEAFDAWLSLWRGWAEVARLKLEVQQLYHTMYEMYTRHQGASETLEAVLALGFLTWHSPETGVVRRHLLTMPVILGFDSDFGAISVSLDPEALGYSAELSDILDTAHMSAPRDLERAESEARTGDIEPFDRENVGALVRMFINCINPDAEYFDELTPGAPGIRPTARYAPAVILRRRGNRGMVTTLRAIAATIRASGALPAGIHNLVDPNYRSTPTPPESSGAIVRDGKDQFLPLQLNQRQHEILEHVDHHAHTLVQGPPGTGKTHTAAALITHLLAQGKRVLITAHTDRALHEVRAKLPEDIKPLCVAVVGDSRQEHEDLKASINRISQAAADYHPDRSREQIAAVEIEIDILCAQRAGVHSELLALRERDVITHSVAGYTGTTAVIAGRWRAEQPDHGWISDLIEVDPDRAEPITGVLIREWRSLLLASALDDPEVVTGRLPSESELPPVETFEQWCIVEERAHHHRREFARFDGDPIVAHCARLTGEQRARAREALEECVTRASVLRRRPDGWVPLVLNAVHNGLIAEWQVRKTAVERALSGAGASVAAVGFTNVQVAVTDSAGLLALAEALKQHIATNGPLRLRPDGLPKTGLGTARIVKDAGPLFEQVRIDGRVPVTVEQLDMFLNMQRAQLFLHQLDMAWPVPFPAIGQPRDRLARHRAAYDLLEQILDYAAGLEQAGMRLREFGLPVPDWGNDSEIRSARDTFETAEAQESCERAAAPFNELVRRLAAPDNDAGPTLGSLEAAARRRDIASYRVAWARLAELNRLRRMVTRRAELTETMAALPGLCAALIGDPANTDWDTRLDRFDSALRWAEVGDWLYHHNVGGANELCRKLDNVEAELRKRAGRLAGITAWDWAVGRLTLQAQADLRQYAQLVKGLGKGKGAYAEGKKAGIQAALTNCRTAVPVWIMPIYRVVEQFSVTADMFDVVLVDEASQAGVEAVFLQYLAPRIVVVGDDKQVSPSAVGVDESELGRLVAQYLYDDRYLESWKNPRRSLFDDASMRYPKRITLVEHRRCVPEIIEFSNKIAYEQEGVRLVPVRRYGSD